MVVLRLSDPDSPKTAQGEHRKLYWIGTADKIYFSLSTLHSFLKPQPQTTCGRRYPFFVRLLVFNVIKIVYLPSRQCWFLITTTPFPIINIFVHYRTDSAWRNFKPKESPTRTTSNPRYFQCSFIKVFSAKKLKNKLNYLFLFKRSVKKRISKRYWDYLNFYPHLTVGLQLIPFKTNRIKKETRYRKQGRPF